MGSSFNGVIAFALLASMLILGSILRNRIGFFRKSLIPASLIGGAVGFALLSMDLIPGYSSGDFTVLTFHFFTLSFMSLCLTGKSKQHTGSAGKIVKGGLWLTVAWSVSLGFQGVLGFGTILAYDAVTGAQISEYLGALITHGFTQGPGQALTYGGIWEKSFGVEDAAQVGLIYASLGFIVAFMVGVPVAKRFIRRGQNTNQSSNLNDEFQAGFYHRDNAPETGKMISHPGNLDNLAYHLALLAVAYGITHIWLSFMQPVVADVKPLGINFSVLFSHNMFFLHGLAFCVLMRIGLDKTGLAERVDDETLKRITGSSVDFMVVGTLMSIKFTVLSALLIPITLVTLVITVATLTGCLFIGRLSGKLGPERAVTSFGCCCGSTGSGLLLLRMLDPDFSTSVAKELAFFNLAIMVVNFHIFFIFAPIAPSLGWASYFAIFGGTSLCVMAAVPLLLRRKFRTAGAVEKVA